VQCGHWHCTTFPKGFCAHFCNGCCRCWARCRVWRVEGRAHGSGDGTALCSSATDGGSLLTHIQKHKVDRDEGLARNGRSLSAYLIINYMAMLETVSQVRPTPIITVVVLQVRVTPCTLDHQSDGPARAAGHSTPSCPAVPSLVVHLLWPACAGRHEGQQCLNCLPLEYINFCRPCIRETVKGRSCYFPHLAKCSTLPALQDNSGYVLFVRLVGPSLDYQTWEAWGPGAQVEVEGAR
jgi:hypothetical protein